MLVIFHLKHFLFNNTYFRKEEYIFIFHKMIGASYHNNHNMKFEFHIIKK
jgi:hypothetical protein